MSTWAFLNIKGQGHSLTFVHGHSDSTFSNFFCSETARPIEANFHMEPPCDVRNENLFKCSRSHDHAHIWWKDQCFHMMTMGWPCPFLWQGQNFFWMLLHWVLLYFQVCSNSAYPQHSGERKEASAKCMRVFFFFFFFFLLLTGFNTWLVKSTPEYQNINYIL